MSLQYRKYMAYNPYHNATATGKIIAESETTGSGELPETEPINEGPSWDKFANDIDSILEYYTDELNQPQYLVSFQEQQDEQYLLFKEKSRIYGLDNITGGLDITILKNKKEVMLSLYFRMRDKLNRMRSLIDGEFIEPHGEAIEDTLNDLSNYSNIALLVKNNNWK